MKLYDLTVKTGSSSMARAVELDRPPLPDVGVQGWSMMRRGIATPASDRWQEVREIGLQVREVAREFRTQAREWLERTLDRVQAARAGRGEDRGAEVERHVDRAGHALTQQDRERERALEQERALERQRAAEREGPSHER